MKIKNQFPVQPPDPKTQLEKLDGQLRNAAKMYEQHFLGEMVKAMRSTINREHGLIQENMAENIFTEQLDQQYEETWANKGGIGLADMIYNQMHERLFPHKDGLGRPAGPIPVDKKTVPFDIHTQSQSPERGQMIFKLKPESGGGTGSSPGAGAGSGGSGAGAGSGGSGAGAGSGGSSASPTPVVSPWKGRVESASTDPVSGWSHVSLKHDVNQMRSQLAFRGGLAALQIGDDVEEGASLGTMSPENTILRWDLEALG